jgi:hypothetical protein
MKQCAKYFACAMAALVLFASRAGAQSSGKPRNDVRDNFFVPVGETADGISFPYWENGKLKRMFFNVAFLQRRDLDHLQLKNANIKTFDDNGNTDLVLLLPSSIFDLKTQLLTTDQRFVLKRSDFELMGDALELDTAKRQATIKGKIKIIIYNFQEPARKETPHE